jgi:hypothetical protein
LTNLHAMLIVILIWAVIGLHGLGVLPRAIDYAITYVYEQPCDCTTDIDCQERCGGEY